VTEGERARLFVALELPETVRRALVGWREDVVASSGVAVRGVREESMHVTLCFLGWRGIDEIEAIASACQTAARGRSCASLSLAGAVWLPPRRPRVLAVSLADTEARLGSVQAELSDVLAAGGWYVPEQRPFLAHVTVARVPKGVRVRRDSPPAPDPISFAGNVVTLFRSRLGRGGAVYEPLASVHLAEPAPPAAPGAASSRASSATSGDPRPST
jgi:RNA 2',3'-cyclic 3'-phosphodiesterase